MRGRSTSSWNPLGSARLDALPDDADHREFMTEITALASHDNPAFTLDYWRLNLAATRPLLP
jgi:hypothetical protein